MNNNIESKIDIDEEKPDINLTKNEKDLCIDEFRAKYSALQAIDNAIKNFDGTNATQIIENAKSINYLDTARNMTQEIYDAVTADYTNGLRTSYENLDAPSRVVDGVTVLDVTDQDYSLHPLWLLHILKQVDTA